MSEWASKALHCLFNKDPHHLHRYNLHFPHHKPGWDFANRVQPIKKEECGWRTEEAWTLRKAQRRDAKVTTIFPQNTAQVSFGPEFTKSYESWLRDDSHTVYFICRVTFELDRVHHLNCLKVVRQAHFLRSSIVYVSKSQVSTLTLSSDITLRQYCGDNTEHCHSRRAKALWDHKSPEVFSFATVCSWAILDVITVSTKDMVWKYTTVHGINKSYFSSVRCSFSNSALGENIFSWFCKILIQAGVTKDLDYTKL